MEGVEKLEVEKILNKSKWSSEILSVIKEVYSRA